MRGGFTNSSSSSVTGLVNKPALEQNKKLEYPLGSHIKVNYHRASTSPVRTYKNKLVKPDNPVTVNVARSPPQAPGLSAAVEERKADLPLHNPGGKLDVSWLIFNALI